MFYIIAKLVTVATLCSFHDGRSHIFTLTDTTPWIVCRSSNECHGDDKNGDRQADDKIKHACEYEMLCINFPMGTLLSSEGSLVDSNNFISL